MIVKHIPMNSIKKSSFAGLVGYITNAQNKQERVGFVSVTNCHQSDALDAVLEVEATQAQNTRALSDKNYHILVSFRAGEKPDQKVLKAIESRICSGLGYGEHQRVSAIHHDTDNLHIHVAINKIHPTRHTIHEPYYDYKILGQLCEKLEIAYGLERDNHIAQKCSAENRAEDMEHNAGIESLIGFIKRECLLKMKEAQTWPELHRLLRENGLEMRQQGNGLIVFDQKSDIAVKASSIDRALSKNKLEARLGAFEKSEFSGGDQKSSSSNGRHYAKKPVHTKINTVELYAKYKDEQLNIGAVRTSELASLRAQKNRLIEKAKNASRLKRSVIKLLKNDGINKKILYALTSKSLKKEIEKTNKQYLSDRQKVYEKYRRRAWADWLKQKSVDGDKEALETMRAREGRGNFKGNTASGKAEKNSHQPSGVAQDNITKKGTIIYRVGTSAIRDDGKYLEITRDASQDGLKALLLMAVQRYGQCLTINGSDQFKERVVLLAVTAKFNITFDDANLEQRRQYLMTSSTTQEQNYDHQQDRGRKDSRSAHGVRHSARYGSTAGNVGKRPTGKQPGQWINKPNIARVGSNPPPDRKNRLRNLSQLNVVHIAGRSEMLLPRDVHGQLEHQRAKSDNSLRRGVSRPRIVGKIESAKKPIKKKGRK